MHQAGDHTGELAVLNLVNCHPHFPYTISHWGESMSKPFGFISKLLGSKNAEKPPVRTDPPTTAKQTYKITPEIQEILELLETSNGKVIFVTGAAGTGKSTLIEILRSETKKKVLTS